MNSGTISIVYGPMFSGKTQELVRLVKRFTVAQLKCLLITHTNSDEIDELKQTKYLDCTIVNDLIDINTDDYNVIAIDNGQFFDDIVQFCESRANQGKILLIAALDGTFERKPYKNILQLIPIAERITKLTAVCWFCKKENGSFTKRIVEEKQIELIGKQNYYRPACRSCYFKEQ